MSLLDPTKVDRPLVDVDLAELAAVSADLEHKPWAPEEGQLWMAAFSCTFEDATSLEAELNVAPDITITLPPPGQAAGGAKRGRRERPAR